MDHFSDTLSRQLLFSGFVVGAVPSFGMNGGYRGHCALAL